jgi:hypothetical protein
MMLETLSQHVNAPIGIGTTTYTETRSSRTKTETSPTMAVSVYVISTVFLPPGSVRSYA